MIPPDALCQGRYSEFWLGKLHLRQFRPCEGSWRYRLRWAPSRRWPEHPWAIFAFPFWRRFEADAIDARGELVRPELAAELWRCASCGATWEFGLICPSCLTVVPRDTWPPLPAPEPAWLTLN